MRKPRCISFRYAAVWLTLAAAGSLRAEALSPEALSPAQVEAAFLLNFTKYIEWPEEAFENTSSPFAICVLGEDPFGDTLDQLMQGESAQGRQLTIKRIRRAPGSKSCQVLYIAEAEKNVRALISDLGPGVLTIGHGSSFLKEGGIIAFVIDGRHVRFDVNQRAAAKSSLSISARLLSVARSVLR